LTGSCAFLKDQSLFITFTPISHDPNALLAAVYSGIKKNLAALDLVRCIGSKKERDKNNTLTVPCLLQANAKR